MNIDTRGTANRRQMLRVRGAGVCKRGPMYFKVTMHAFTRGDWYGPNFEAAHRAVRAKVAALVPDLLEVYGYCLLGIDEDPGDEVAIYDRDGNREVEEVTS